MHNDYQPTADLLRDRTLLVTGAGDGIGRAVSLAFAAHGATVVLLGKTVRKLEAVYDAIEASGGPTPAIYPMHLEGATPHDFDALAETLQTNFGRLDGMLHNAATLPYLSRIKDYDPTDWLKVMQVNLNAPFALTQSCLPLLEQSADARLLFTTDAAGHRAKAFWGAYGVSKFGVEGLAQTLAEELEKTAIRVNWIDPGPTRTALRRRVFPGEDLGALKSPESLVPLYLWAMGPDSRDCHGARLCWDD
jgi:NAD(P)-dependent dehydrogenase (short-subunit alcohol dehydrogenase family)